MQKLRHLHEAGERHNDAQLCDFVGAHLATWRMYPPLPPPLPFQIACTEAACIAPIWYSTANAARLSMLHDWKCQHSRRHQFAKALAHMPRPRVGHTLGTYGVELELRDWQPVAVCQGRHCHGRVRVCSQSVSCWRNRQCRTPPSWLRGCCINHRS